MAGLLRSRKKFVIRTICEDGLGNINEDFSLFVGGSVGAQKRMNKINDFLSTNSSYVKVRVFLYEISELHRVAEII